MAKYLILHNCPVPAKLHPELKLIAARTGASLNSCYRGTDAESLLRRYGKQSQRQLYNLYLAGRGNPANKPGFSTHELRSDGVAYRIPRGLPLRYWQVGQDWSDPGAVVREAKRLGFTATVTYPTNPREGHHINFRKEPRLAPAFKPLHVGATGRRVKGVTRRLAFIKDPHGHHYLQHAYNTYTPEVDRAVRKFQRDHHQRADGIYGRQTARQLDASVRYRKKKNKENK